jgi:hypothetical protein
MSISLPTLIQEGFGTGDGGKTNPIPVASQIGVTAGAASFTDGFPPLTRTPLNAGGLPPSGEDMNGILYMITQLQAWQCSGGQIPWQSAQETAIGGYPLYAVVQNSDGSGYWLNLTANNTTDPDTGGAGWVPVGGAGQTSITVAGSNVTLTALQAARPYLFISGTLTANITVSIPAPLAGQTWIVVNETTGAFSVSLASVAGGATVVVPQSGNTSFPAVVYCDGTNIQLVVTALTGYAPINSPNFTGTPTAPTPPSNANTTQIATTAMVQAAITAAVAALAPRASPTLSGNPTAPTQAPGTNNATLATTAFVQAAAGNSAVNALNGGLNFANGIQIRWGQVNHSAAGVQTHAFSAAFSNGCYVVIPVVASSTGVEFFTYQSSTASGWTQYSNNTTLINYIAIGH